MKPSDRTEVLRLHRALKNFLALGYDANFQHTESAIEQLDKLRKLAIRNILRTKRKGKR